ncbi:hypothetical protein Psi01_38500 [Planobispora siamensis]|uniref:Uncharacterized protein n=1 Tax=Planobispora siamensis TaxID=936338 RepID=A0A8J3SIV4_9ACTN|nr:hypothetical protein Psi01_38500 [Planobispora siamensis]
MSDIDAVAMSCRRASGTGPGNSPVSAGIGDSSDAGKVLPGKVLGEAERTFRGGGRAEKVIV